MDKIFSLIEREDLDKALKAFAKEHEEKVFDKFYSVFVNAKTVANIHGTSEQTVLKYIKSGILIPEPSEGRVHRFRLSYILKIDFSQLLRKRHYGK